MKALDFAVKAENQVEARQMDGGQGYDLFDVDPGKMYPAFLEYCKKLRASFEKLKAGMPLEKGDEEIPAELRPNPMNHVQKLTDQACELALVPFEETPALSSAERLQRDFALETARLVFTAMARKAVAGSVHVHILKGDGGFKLCDSNIRMD